MKNRSQHFYKNMAILQRQVIKNKITISRHHMGYEPFHMISINSAGSCYQVWKIISDQNRKKFLKVKTLIEKQMLRVKQWVRRKTCREQALNSRTQGKLDSRNAYEKCELVYFVNQNQRPGGPRQHYCFQRVSRLGSLSMCQSALLFKILVLFQIHYFHIGSSK